MAGKLYVIDGVDGTGKSTQLEKIKQYMKENYKGEYAIIEFPRYGNESAKMVEKYLNGEITDPNQLVPDAVANYYACDRRDSYRNDEWGRVYDNGGLVISSRYTTSNMIHQGCKFTTPSNTIDASRFMFFCRRVAYKEYLTYGIPKPDKVVYLTGDPAIIIGNIDKRAEETGVKKDIHESNKEYIRTCISAVKILDYINREDFATSTDYDFARAYHNMSLIDIVNPYTKKFYTEDQIFFMIMKEFGLVLK